MEMSWLKPILVMVVSALVVSSLTRIDNNRPEDPAGWYILEPGIMYTFAISSSTVLTLIFGYIWLFVGSSLPDRDTHMLALCGLTLASAITALLAFYQRIQAKRSAVRWREDVICWLDKRGIENKRNLSSAVELRSSFMGPVFIVFDDGIEARIDPYTHNANKLIHKVSSRLYPDDDYIHQDEDEDEDDNKRSD
jgi:hypothetical protein